MNEKILKNYFKNLKYNLLINDDIAMLNIGYHFLIKLSYKSGTQVNLRNQVTCCFFLHFWGHFSTKL